MYPEMRKSVPPPPGRRGPIDDLPLPQEEKARQLAINQFTEIVANAYSSRSELMKRLVDPRRDIDAECGYPRGRVAVSTFQDLYDREAVAVRVVQVLPRETWQVEPEVYETDDSSVSTVFEEAWNNLGKGLRTEPSYHRQASSGVLWEHLRRADELSGIGHYGVLFLGLDDGGDLSQPVKPAAGRKLLFLRTFAEPQAQVTRFDSNPLSPRFCQPEAYLLTVNDPRDFTGAATGYTTSTLTVHWSRIVHLADNLGSSEVFGTPRMLPVLNRLLDLRKLYGGSAEMYWRGAFPGLSLETHPTLGGEAKINYPGLQDMMEAYSNGLQRYLALAGMSARSLAPQVVDPTAQINVQIDAICIKLGVPKRVFLGSERGELASIQDDAAWNDRLKERQSNYLTPRVIVPLVDRLINLGVLPEPPDGYVVSWPDLTSQTKQQKANIAVSWSQALSQYITSGIWQIIPPDVFLAEVMGVPEQEAISIVERAKAEGWRPPMLDTIATPSPRPPQQPTGTETELDGGRVTKVTAQASSSE